MSWRVVWMAFVAIVLTSGTLQASGLPLEPTQTTTERVDPWRTVDLALATFWPPDDSKPASSTFLGQAEEAIAFAKTLRTEGAGAEAPLHSFSTSRLLDAEPTKAVFDRAIMGWRHGTQGLQPLIDLDSPFTGLVAGPDVHTAERAPRPDTARYNHPNQALEDLFTMHQTAVPQHMHADLEQLPSSLWSPITRIIEAHILQTETVRLMLAHGWDFGILLDMQSVAASILLDASQYLHCVQDGAAEDDHPIFQYDFGCADSFYSEDASLLLDMGGNDTYENSAGGCIGCAATLIDAAGNDTYQPLVATPKKFATTGGAIDGSGMLFDLQGRNTYIVDVSASTSARGVANGAADHGLGLLVDLGGGSTFTANLVGAGDVELLANGAGRMGAGTLIAGHGPDTFNVTVIAEGDAEIAGNGAGFAGAMGILMDTGGDDRYETTVTAPQGIVAANGAARVAGPAEADVPNPQGAMAFLADAAGDDRYKVVTDALFAHVNGAGGAGGFGALVDGNGNDHYSVVSKDVYTLSANGGATKGTGILRDLDGNDEYDLILEGTRFSARVSGHGGAVGELSVGTDEGFYATLAVLEDAGGHDQYTSTVTGSGEMAVALNGGAYLGTGFLTDNSGNDSYIARIHQGDPTAALNGGAIGGVAVLTDLDGHDTYLAKINGTRDVQAAIAGGGALGFGALRDAGGDDHYDVQVATNLFGAVSALGASHFAGVGLLVDNGGNNSYVAGPGGFAQGAADLGGLGVLVDAGDRSVLRLRNETVGQGIGVYGGGVLVRDNPTGITTYLVEDTAIQGQNGALGVGLQLDVGFVTPDSQLPDLSCPREAYVDEPVALGILTWHLRVCNPVPEDAHRLASLCPSEVPCGEFPSTLPKPGVPCSSACQFLTSLLPGDGWAEWLEREDVDLTFNGGFSASYRNYVGSPSPLLFSTVTPARADNVPWCDPACSEG